MKFVLFCQSIISDWNHGNAHFLRGIAAELLARGHTVEIYEPRDGWSITRLIADQGLQAVAEFEQAFPSLDARRYGNDLDVNAVLADADVVLVHEWNDPELVARVGEVRARKGTFRLFFHDTHHRAVSAAEQMADYDLSSYDGVLAFGAVLRDAYLANKWTAHAWAWHEAADVRTFRRRPAARMEGDLVWIGNWGDGEREPELKEFLIDPVRLLGLRAVVYGVRYSRRALSLLEEAGIDYRGWLPNYRVPEVFSRFRVTVHVPRGPYRETLRGIPTIRPFEALACEIPLVSAPWDDSESLFTPGKDYLCAEDGGEMIKQLFVLLKHREAADALAAHGRATIDARHTCAHRIDELLAIHVELGCERHASAPVARCETVLPAVVRGAA